MENNELEVEDYIIKKLTETVLDEINGLNEENIEKDRFMYALCSDEDEKSITTKSEIKEIQFKLTKCNTEISGFIQAFLTHEFFTKLDGLTFDETKEKIVRNFLINSQDDIIEILKSCHKNDNIFNYKDFEFWNLEVLTNLGLDKKLVKHFIKKMALAERLLALKSCLDTESNKTKHQFVVKSFKYTGKAKEQSKLTDLMNSLKKRGFIDSETSLGNFRKVFNQERIEAPITWTGSVSELHYFIKQLHSELNYVENVKQQIWNITKTCFVDKEGKEYNNTQLRTQKKPVTSNNVDMCLNTLK
ncbi:hypothetical protein [Wenyingzhuangia sp. IMCC45574]